MISPQVKGIIFDYGGTIDSRGVHWSEVIWDGYLASGLRIAKDSFRETYVYAERELAKTRHILPHHNFHDLLLIKMRIEMSWLVEHGLLESEQLESAAHAVADFCYEAAQSSIRQARPVLETLHKRYPMVLVSNFYGNVTSVLEDFDLLRYFGEIVESAVVGVRKPDPRIFGLGVEALGMKPEETLVVGDSLRKDIEPARSLGCHVAWLKGKGWTAEEDAVTDPAMIYSLNELLEPDREF